MSLGSGNPGGGGNITINVSVMVQQALAAFQRLQTAATGALNRIQRQAQATRIELTGIDRILSYMAAGSIVAAVGGFTRLASEIQRTSLMMIALEGDMQKATIQMDRMVALTQKVPFSIGAVSDAFVKLKTSGIEPIIDAQGNGPLRNLLDAVAAFGGTEQQLHRAAIALQQMAGKGTISMEELRQQLGEAIPTAIRLMAEGLGVTVPQLIAQITKGQLEFEKGFAALDRMFKEKYGGLGEIIKKVSLSGAFEGLRNEIEQLALTLNRIGALDALTAGLHLAAKAIREFHNAIAPVTGNTRDYADATEAVSKSLERMSGWVEKNADNIVGFIRGLQNLMAVFGALFNLVFAVLDQFPADMVAGGIVGYLFFGRSIRSALIFALLARSGEAVSGFVNFIAKIISALPQGVVAYGLIGYVLFGARGALLGVLAATVLSVMRTIEDFIAKATGKMAAAIAYVSAQVNNLNPFSPTKRNADADAKTAEGQAEKAFRSRRPVTWADNLYDAAKKMDASFQGTGTKDGERLAQAARDFKTELKAIQEARAELAKAMKPLETPVGLNASQEAQMTKAMQHMADMEERLVGLKLGAGAKIRKENELYLKQGEEIVKSLRAQAALEKDPKKQAQLIKTASDTEAAYAKMRATVEGLAQAEDARSGSRAAAKARRAAEQHARQLDSESDRIERFKSDLEKYAAQINELELKVFGGSEVAIARAEAQTDIASIRDRYNDMAVAINNLKLKEEDRAKLLQDLEGLQNRLNLAEIRAIQIAEEKVKIEQRRNALERARYLEDLDRDITVKGFEQDPFSGRMLRNFGIQTEWEDKIREIQDRIQEAQDKLTLNPNTDERPGLELFISDLEARVAAYDKYYSYMLSKERELHDATRTLWEDTGSIIRNSLEDAIYNLITGTGSAKQAVLAMYQEITKAAIRYLMQVIMIKMIEGALSFATGGLSSAFSLGAGVFGGVPSGGAKAGATFQRFGRGGAFTNTVVRGPTNFNIGEMGEAGPEGVLPLASVNGRLGVYAKSGGDQYNVTIHAVDARSIRDLLMQHGDAIIPALVGQGRLNNSVGRTR